MVANRAARLQIRDDHPDFREQWKKAPNKPEKLTMQYKRAQMHYWTLEF